MERNHVRFVVMCITILGVFCIAGGTILIFKGYNGDLLIGGGLAAISGLVGMLAMSKPVQRPQDVTVSGTPPTVEVSQPVEQQKT